MKIFHSQGTYFTKQDILIQNEFFGGSPKTRGELIGKNFLTNQSVPPRSCFFSDGRMASLMDQKKGL